MRSKKFLLLTCQVLGHLFKTLAPNDKYPVLNRGKLKIPIHMILSQKQKTIFQFFSAFLKSILNFNFFLKKMTLIDFVFPKLRSLKTWLDKCLNIPVSEDPLKSNMGNGPRHFWNLHCSTFIILIDNFQGIWVGKNVSYWHDKSWDCLLTHWLPMAIILFLIGTT